MWFLEDYEIYLVSSQMFNLMFFFKEDRTCQFQKVKHMI